MAAPPPARTGRAARASAQGRIRWELLEPARPQGPQDQVPGQHARLRLVAGEPAAPDGHLLRHLHVRLQERRARLPRLPDERAARVHRLQRRRQRRVDERARQRGPGEEGPLPAARAAAVVGRLRARAARAAAAGPAASSPLVSGVNVFAPGAAAARAGARAAGAVLHRARHPGRRRSTSATATPATSSRSRCCVWFWANPILYQGYLVRDAARAPRAVLGCTSSTRWRPSSPRFQRAVYQAPLLRRRQRRTRPRLLADPGYALLPAQPADRLRHRGPAAAVRVARLPAGCRPTSRRTCDAAAPPPGHHRARRQQALPHPPQQGDAAQGARRQGAAARAPTSSGRCATSTSSSARARRSG